MKTLAIVLTSILLTSTNSFAQTTPVVATQNAALNIAIINTDEVLKNSNVMKYIGEKVAAQEKRYQSDIDKKYAALEKDFKKIEAKKSVLSEAALKEEEKQFATKFTDLKTELETKQKSIKSTSIEALTQVDKKVVEIVEKISKEKGLDLILPSSNVIFYEEKLDISADVLKELNRSLKSVKINFN